MTGCGVPSHSAERAICGELWCNVNLPAGQHNRLSGAVKKTLIIYLNDKIMNAGSGTLCDNSNNRKTIYTHKKRH